MASRDYYIRLRNKYLPKKLKVIFVLESPPDSDDGRFFYNPDGRTSEALFSAMMKAIFDINYRDLNNKAEGLEKFQKAGCFVIDATYISVNKMEDSDREKQILNDLDELKKELKRYAVQSTKIILVVKRLYNLITDKLTESSIKIANLGNEIPFPRFNEQKEEFIEKIRKELAK